MSRSFLVPILLPADPAVAMEAATKQYVDAKFAAGGISQADADIRYVNIPGDTMTGLLTVPLLNVVSTATNINTVVFKAMAGQTNLIFEIQNSAAASLLMFDVNGKLYTRALAVNDSNNSHWLTIACGSDLTANRNLNIFTGDATRALTLNSDVALDQHLRTTDSPTFGSRVKLGQWSANTQYSAIEASTGAGYLLLGNASEGNTYLNAAAGAAVRFRTGGTDRMNVLDAGISVVGSIITTNASGQVMGRQAGSSGGSSYLNAALYANAGANGNGAPCLITNHPGSFANQWREAWNDPNSYVRNADDGGYHPFYCDVIDTSSGRYKQDVVPLRERIAVGALDRVRALRPIHHRLRREHQLTQIVYDKDMNDVGRALHVCGPDCISGDDHTDDNPCVMVQEWNKGRFGLIAEEVADVLPEVTHRNNFDGQVEGIKTLGLVAVLVAAVQELADQVTELKAQVAALTP